MTQSPLVSIIIPAYNAERYIARCLRSAVDQTCKNIEILVVDDGSTDETAEIVKSFGDDRITCIRQQNQGQGAARNNGIRNSKGKYITFLDADDYYMPEKVERQADFLEHSEYRIVYCNALHFYSDRPDRLLKKKYKCPSGDIFEQLLHTSLINPNTIMLEREILLDGIMFGEGAYGRYSEEWQLYLNISRAGFEFGYLDQDLAVVEIRTDSNTQWDSQWIIKKNVLEMIEHVTASMSGQEKKKYKINKVLKEKRSKLAIAYLIGKRRKEFFKVFVSLFPYPLKPFATLIGAGLMVFSKFLRNMLIRFWKANQLRSFVTVQSYPVPSGDR